MGMDNIKTSLIVATGAGLSAFSGLQYLNKYYLDKSWTWLAASAWGSFGASLATYGYIMGGAYISKPKN
jgi:hypothetical protein